MPVALQSLEKSWFDKNASERTAAISEARTMPMPISSQIALGSGTDDSSGCKASIMCSFLFLSRKYTVSPFSFFTGKVACACCPHLVLERVALSFCHPRTMGQE